MDLNEARKVLWIRPNRKPVGELVDEGLISKGQLEWAAANAYNADLKKAAKIILFTLEKINAAPANSTKPENPDPPKIEMPVSITQAQATLWPLPPYKNEPIGTLLNEKKIALKDLGYAIENAWDQKVRDAALVLAAIRMNQIVKEPRPPQGHVSVFSKGRSYSSKRQLEIGQVRGGTFGFTFGVLVFWMVILVFGKRSTTSTLTIADILASPSGIAALIIAFAILIGLMILLLFTVNQTVKELDDLAESFRKGEEGEERVADAIKKTLNGEWSFFRNLTIPGQKGGDIDSVIVGPTGIWSLEIKSLSGKFRNIGEIWQFLEKKGWQNVKRNPSMQARKNALRLRSLFEADHLSTFVNPVVVWANPESPLEIENPSVAVWKLDRLEDELGNIQEGKPIPDADRKKICEKLTRLITRQK
jgi:hypothetical protein